MGVQKYRRYAAKMLNLAGITINGKQPYDMRVNNENFYRRIFSRGSLGLGESYMDGWWDAPALDEFFFRILQARLDRKIRNYPTLILQAVLTRIFNRQAGKRALIIGKRHYDLGNDLFQRMLDSGMNYSCGYWKNADGLEEAQSAKLDLICQKIGLKPGLKVLDIGCGWGGFAKFAAEKYHVEVVGITVSREQASLARERCRGLSVQIRLQDYRTLREKFDRIVSVGMFEHVGYKNYSSFMQVVRRCLKKDGLFLLHTIGGNQSVKSTNPWTEKYIFPNSMLPSVEQIGKAISGLFVMEDWHNFGPDYDKTLMAWYQNFKQNWPRIRQNYDERFFRMWKYFLLSSAGSFRARVDQLWELVLSVEGVVGGVPAIR